MLKFALILIFCSLIYGCATQKVGPPPPGMPPIAEVPPPEKPEVEALLKYSDINNMAPQSDRNYRRMTRQTMEEEAQLQASAGSLWVMEGQSSFLFSQNKHHSEGDPTAIKVEGMALKQIESKVAVIQDLMKELEKLKIQSEEDQKTVEKDKLKLAEEEKAKKDREWRVANDPNFDPYEGQYPEDPAKAALRAPAAASDKKSDTASAEADKVAKEDVVDLKELDSIPSKIVEKTKDGMYRIRGQQFLTIKKRPYKVIATALVRAEDFNDAGISSTKLLDSQYDVIHIKRTE